MDKPKHTPGPWRVVARHAAFGVSRGITTVGSSTHGAVADCGGCSVSVAQDEANARLIAAAPELLDALRETLRALESHLDESCRDHNLKHRDFLCPCNQNEVQRARDAIRKATGGE